MEAQARKYTSPYRDVIRAKIVLLASDGLRNDVIAARLDTPRQIVSKWRQRFFEERLAGLEEEPRGGHRARFSPSVVVDVKRLACELPSQSDVPLARWTIPELHRQVGAWDRGADQRRHTLALAEYRRLETMAASHLDLSARSAVC